MTQTLIEKIDSLLETANMAEDVCPRGEYVIRESDLRAIIEEYKATEQEPVGEIFNGNVIVGDGQYYMADLGALPNGTKLFTHPQPSDETVKVPEGYALVPIEPTEAMMMAGTEQWYKTFTQTDLYKAMIDEAMKADNEKI